VKCEEAVGFDWGVLVLVVFVTRLHFERLPVFSRAGRSCLLCLSGSNSSTGIACLIFIPFVSQNSLLLRLGLVDFLASKQALSPSFQLLIFYNSFDSPVDSGWLETEGVVTQSLRETEFGCLSLLLLLLLVVVVVIGHCDNRFRFSL